MNYNLEGMTKEEGRTYIHAKLKGAGIVRQILCVYFLHIIYIYNS